MGGAKLDESTLSQSLQVELLRIRQMAQHAGNPLLVYFIEMAIQHTKKDSFIGGDGSVAGGERGNQVQNGFARFD
jgi:hypothetical protein